MTYPIQEDGIAGSTPAGKSKALGSSSRLLTKEIAHISVCVCTFKRPHLLQRLLTELASQETKGGFTYSVVVVDNDTSRSAESVTSEFVQSSSTPVRYVAEPRQNIALARNRAVENAVGMVEDEYIVIGGWPVQFLPPSDELEREAVEDSVSATVESVRPRVMTAEHL